MSNQVAIGRVDEVAAGQITRFEVVGIGAIAAYCVAGRYYATSDECSHGIASLSTDGVLDGHVVECTWHGGRFDIRTGAFLNPPCSAPLKVYPLAVAGAELLMTVDP